jgi:hypothetical protein
MPGDQAAATLRGQGQLAADAGTECGDPGERGDPGICVLIARSRAILVQARGHCPSPGTFLPTHAGIRLHRACSKWAWRARAHPVGPGTAHDRRRIRAGSLFGDYFGCLIALRPGGPCSYQCSRFG